jgi:acetyl-CoA carboxylase biotin carboxyl carrier protein
MAEKLTAHITGTVVRIEKAVGAPVAPGEAVVIIESMKMEMAVEALVGGAVVEIRCQPGQAVAEGDLLVVLG